MKLVHTIERDGDTAKIEIEKIGNDLNLWQDKGQPYEDSVTLTPAAARNLRDFLNAQDL